MIDLLSKYAVEIVVLCLFIYTFQLVAGFIEEDDAMI
jgi:hypothetical protein